MTCQIVSREEWLEKTAPFTWMRIDRPVVAAERMRAWIEDHCGAGWVWLDSNESGEEVFIAFGDDADYVLFKIWLLSQ